MKSRGVLWPYSQPSAPMETLYAEVEDLEKAYPYGPAYVDSAGKVLNTKYYKQWELGLRKCSFEQRVACLYSWGYSTLQTVGLGCTRTSFLVPEHCL